MQNENELIASFMGFRKYPYIKEQKRTHASGWIRGDNTLQVDPANFLCGLREGEMKYDTSWDWLMPVVEKIAEYRMAYPKEAGWVCDCKIVVYRHILYREVVNFIKFYNSQPK